MRYTSRQSSSSSSKVEYCSHEALIRPVNGLQGLSR